MSINHPQPQVVVYGQPGCQQCKTMKRHLDTKQVEYQYIDVTEDEKAMKWLDDMGYQSVPVTRIGFTHFAGFDPDQANRALATLAA